MNPTKILIDARAIGGEGQGSVTYLKGLYTSLNKKFGAQYDLFFAGYDYKSLVEAFPFVKKNRFVLLESKSKLKLFTRIFPKIIKDNQIQFAHFQYVTPFIKNCKFIVTTHDVLFNDFEEDFSKWYSFKRNFLFKSSLVKSDIRLTVSNYSKERITVHYGLPIDSLHITPNAVREEFFEDFDNWSIEKQIEHKFKAKNYLLYVSRIEPRKNHKMIIDAYRNMQLSKQGIQLVFIGNDTLNSKKDMDEIRKMEVDFPNHFHFLSGLSDKDMLDFYRAAKLFVYPSKAEGFGIPPIEAAAAKVRTLCSNVTAMKDFDFFDKNFFSPYNLDELIHKIQTNLLSPISEEKLFSIQNKIRQKYSWDASSSVLHQLVQQNK